MKNDPVQSALARLDEIPLRTPEGRKEMAKALAAKSNLVVAKAARLVGDAQWTELTDDLVAAFDRFVKRGAEADKGCAATMAVARALFNMDYDEPDLYLSGMRHVQMEPTYGGSVDTAAELRAVCAMGLANTRYPGKLRAFVDLLVDREWQARAGAARALATAGSEAALLLLRFKALTGDRDPEVIADCFSGLLSAEGADAVLFVSSFATSRGKEIREVAILALGASRRADAIEWMKQRFGEIADAETRKCILLSLATARTDAAIEFLIDVIRNGSSMASQLAVAAMEINRGDRTIQGRVEEAVRLRG
ncbi:MAG TPA: hypothetical protein VK789_29330 [Bryobacteraceae bacterium]|jgi:HEAT repeat protein|nr:hypothetical protein [Bryobacteraceae bacterium]